MNSINLIIDNRETKLLSLFEQNIKIENEFILKKENLDLGDIIISSGNFSIIIERKTYSDLISSIYDSRYKEQKSRILSSNYNEKIYIIEKNIISQKELLMSCIINMTIRDNIKIIMSENINNTRQFILKIINNLIKNKIGNSVKNDGMYNYSVNKDLKKNENIPNLAKILNCIKGISLKNAIELSEKCNHNSQEFFELIFSNEISYVIKKLQITKNKYNKIITFFKN